MGMRRRPTGSARRSRRPVMRRPPCSWPFEPGYSLTTSTAPGELPRHLGRAGDDASYMLARIAGLSGDFTTWAGFADVDAHADDANCIPEEAFWLAVQERFTEAALRLDGCDPVPEGAIGGLGAASSARASSSRRCCASTARPGRGTGSGRARSAVPHKTPAKTPGGMRIRFPSSTSRRLPQTRVLRTRLSPR